MPQCSVVDIRSWIHIGLHGSFALSANWRGYADDNTEDFVLWLATAMITDVADVGGIRYKIRRKLNYRILSSLS